MNRRVPAPHDRLERFLAAFLRVFLRVAFQPWIGPRLQAVGQRRLVNALALLMPGRMGLRRSTQQVGHLEIEVLSPPQAEAQAVILYLHGGAFCLGSAATHRGLCSHLAFESGLPVWVPNYRLAPEHPYPCALDDALAAYGALRMRGYSSEHIVVAGDSAGGTLALALVLRLQQQGQALPAGLALISPVTDTNAAAQRAPSPQGVRADPMVSADWLRQGLGWLQVPTRTPEFSPLHTDLAGLPPMLIQAGDEEILLPDATRLAAHAQQCGVVCQLEIHEERWHVFHLQAFYLRSARQALQTLAAFARSAAA